jgi:hypothetical protein
VPPVIGMMLRRPRLLAPTATEAPMSTAASSSCSLPTVAL